MKKENFSQNMKDRMQQFEDGGLRLLKKGQKGIVHAIFSRFGLVLLLMLLQVGVLWGVFRWFGTLLPHYFGGSVAVSVFMVVYILNSRMDNSAKITWMVTIAILPVVGVPLFFYVKSNFGHNALQKPGACSPSPSPQQRRWKRPTPARPRWHGISTAGAAASRSTRTRR